MPIRQEKFQWTTIPRVDEDGPHEWTFTSSDLGGLSQGTLERSEGVFHRRVNTGGPIEVGGDEYGRFNVLPPTAIREPCVEAHKMPLSRRAGDSDVSADLADGDALRNGFTRCEMRATDDQFQGQPCDMFL